MLALAPIADAQNTGAISGGVTEAAGAKAPLQGIGVEAYQPGHESTEGDYGYTTTAANGAYTIEHLAPGNYTVEFYPIFNSGKNVLAQYFSNKTLQQTPTPVSVSEGSIAAGVNAQMQAGATIAGTVIGQSDHKPIAGLRVEAQKITGGTPAQEGYWEYIETDSNGDYALTGLPSGEYKIRFEPIPFFGQNYLGQYYEAGKPLKVTAGGTIGAVNAELVEGGEISGVVTDAVSHAGLAGIGVGAYNQGAGIGGGAYSTANGEYTIAGLPTGTYKVLFEEEVNEPLELEHLPQYFNLASSLAGAAIVTVTQGAKTTAVDAALLRTVPVATAAPAISGTPAPGQTLSCSSGAWTGSPTLAYAYAWLRDGVAIAGAGGASYVVQATDQGHALACEVTASNSYGRAFSSSAGVHVPAATAGKQLPPLPPRISLRLPAGLLVTRGATQVHIACSNALCTGVVELVEQIVVKRRGAHGRGSHTQTIVLAKASYTLAAGRSATIALHLAAAGRKALAHARHHRLPAIVQVSLTGGAKVRAATTLRAAAGHH